MLAHTKENPSHRFQLLDLYLRVKDMLDASIALSMYVYMGKHRDVVEITTEDMTTAHHVATYIHTFITSVHPFGADAHPLLCNEQVCEFRCVPDNITVVVSTHQ